MNKSILPRVENIRSKGENAGMTNNFLPSTQCLVKPYSSGSLKVEIVW